MPGAHLCYGPPIDSGYYYNAWLDDKQVHTHTYAHAHKKYATCVQWWHVNLCYYDKKLCCGYESQGNKFCQNNTIFHVITRIVFIQQQILQA